MPKVSEYRPVGAEYFDAAPVHKTLRQSIPASTASTFRCLLDPDAWPVWLIPVTKVVWTSPKPFGVGTTRDIKGPTGTTSEYFFAWEDGRRMSFYFSKGVLPAVAAFAEDYELVSTGEDSCELVWRYAFECPGIFRLFQPVIAGAFGRVATRSLRNLARYMDEHRARYDAEGP